MKRNKYWTTWLSCCSIRKPSITGRKSRINGHVEMVNPGNSGFAIYWHSYPGLRTFCQLEGWTLGAARKNYLALQRFVNLKGKRISDILSTFFKKKFQFWWQIPNYQKGLRFQGWVRPSRPSWAPAPRRAGTRSLPTTREMGKIDMHLVRQPGCLYSACQAATN